MTKPAFDKDKLKAAIHYVMERVLDRPSDLGAVKLHKVLWFTDLELMYALDRTLCGETFLRMAQGPWGSHVDKAIKSLVTAGTIAERQGSSHGYQQRLFFSLCRPDLSLFSPDEISVLDRMIEIVCFGHTATSISAATHDRVWQLTPEKGVMSAAGVFDRLIVPPDEPTRTWASRPLDDAATSSLAALGLS